MNVSTKLIIERKFPLSTGLWKNFAYPKDNIEEARKTLDYLREEEAKKKFKGELRLVRETREIFVV